MIRRLPRRRHLRLVLLFHCFGRVFAPLLGMASMIAANSSEMSRTRRATVWIPKGSRGSNILPPTGTIFCKSMILHANSPLSTVRPRTIGLCAILFRVFASSDASLHNSSTLSLVSRSESVSAKASRTNRILCESLLLRVLRTRSTPQSTSIQRTDWNSSIPKLRISPPTHSAQMETPVGSMYFGGMSFLQNVKGMARRRTRPKLIRRLPRRRHLRLVQHLHCWLDGVSGSISILPN